LRLRHQGERVLTEKKRQEAGLKDQRYIEE
jgi:hypothetical protein